MGITVDQPAVRSTKACSADDFVDEVCDDEGDGNDGDTPQVENCEQAIDLSAQAIAFTEDLQAAEAAQEQAALAKQIAQNSARASAQNRDDQAKIGGTRVTARAQVRDLGWLQRDSGQSQTTGAVAMAMAQKVGGTSRFESAAERPPVAPVQLGEVEYKATLQADAGTAPAPTSQAPTSGAVSSELGFVDGSSRRA